MQQDVIIKLQDEFVLLEDLIIDTFNLIKKTKTLAPVRKLIEIHDILNLNASILVEYKKSDLTFDEIWLDAPTLKYLNQLRCELLVYHYADFISRQEIDIYNRSFCRFLNLVLLRLKNNFDFDLPEIKTKII
jgi:hypothetical protein